MGFHERIIIIGGGLTGLTLAYLLSKKNINATALEASPRLGGRIQTNKTAFSNAACYISCCIKYCEFGSSAVII